MGQVGGADVELWLGLDPGNYHPIERHPREHGKWGCRNIQDRPPHDPQRPPRRHVPTSVRRASRSIAAATTIRTGSRKSAIAAPWPRSAPRMPRWNARLARTWVLLYGPPRVSRYTIPRSVDVNTTPNSTATVTMGRSRGRST